MFVRTIFYAEFYLLCSAVEISAKIAIPLTPQRSLKKVLNLIASQAAEYRRTKALKKERDNNERTLLQGMESAVTLAEYEECTRQLDEIQGHDVWKEQRDSVEPEYNPGVIEAQMIALQKAAASADLSAMQHLLRTGLSRNLGGMDSLRLYKHSWFGTKILIDDYIATAIDTVESFVNTAIQYNIATSEIQFYQQSLEDALKYFGRSALTLSGGALLGMKHVGVVKTLWQADLLPQVISGASAGSIVAAIAGSSTDEQMGDTLAYFPFSDLTCFDPQGTSLLGWCRNRLMTFYRTGRWFEMDSLERVMKAWLGELTFREAHYKTGRILNICVSSPDSAEPRLLNYITAPDVYLWSAVCASCAVPGVFRPVSIWEKDSVHKKPKLWMQNARQLFVDGSLDHDIPMRKLSEMFNVNFFIVSQVNPHVRAFLTPEECFVGKQPVTPSYSYGVWDKIKQITRLEIIHRAQQAAELGLPPLCYRWAAVFNQQYTGNINILPEIVWTEHLSMMRNPSPQFMLQSIISGEKATWPKMCRIKNCVAIELALLKAIHVLRDRINFGPEARAARDYRQSTRRQGPHRGRSPVFFHRRRHSNELHMNGSNPGYTVSGPPTPSSLVDRRNYSLGNIEDRLRSSMLTVKAIPTPHLSPQAGIDEPFGEALMMTTTPKNKWDTRSTISMD